ncbi:DUF5789 family protein [Halalkalicoccus ordinarius]|uniref:DUF5789 family protein n=1 Tax=Halalkalicoccus ordinarius TaxID=3116651 RepID=UPI00300F2DE4
MSDTPTDRTREIGIDFGSLAQQLEEHEYPATNDELVEQYGESVLIFQNGEQTLREVFEAMATESFNSPRDARQAIFNGVNEQAIGRKGYSDRDPPALGEESEQPGESF